MKRPWNIIDSPVYSLATYNQSGFNMNICTYVTVISLKPKIYCLAIDPNTHTFTNIKKENRFVLQLLNIDNISIVRTLGKKSGKNYDKEKYLMKKDLTTKWNNYDVLKNTNATVELILKKHYKNIGDHDLFTFDIGKFKTYNENNILTFQDLINNKIIL